MEYMGLQLELISQLGWMKQIGYSKEGRGVVLFPCPMQLQSTVRTTIPVTHMDKQDPMNGNVEYVLICKHIIQVSCADAVSNLYNNCAIFGTVNDLLFCT